MTRFANRKSIAYIRTWNETEGSNEGGGAIGKDVPVEVRGDDDVVGGGLAEELVDHAVDYLFVDRYRAELRLGQSRARCFAEESVGLGEDVGFMRYCYDGLGVYALDSAIAQFLPLESDGGGHGGYAVGCALGDAFYCFSDFAGAIWGGEGALFFYVEVFCVFADDDEVDWVLGGEGGLDGADVGVEVELFTEGDDGGGVAWYLFGGGADGSEEGAVTFFLERFDGFVGEGYACLLEGFVAGGEVDEGAFEVEGGGYGF